MADISKITLPSGNTYDIKDAVAREMISGGVSFIICSEAADTPTAAGGDLAPGDAQVGAFYLVLSETETQDDYYDEYVVIGDGQGKEWEKIGDTQMNLSDVVTGVTLNKQTDTVIGSASTFTVTQPTITLNTGSTGTTVATGISSASATGGNVAWDSKDAATALTGVKVTAQPTITLTANTATATGRIKYVEDVTGGSATPTTAHISGTASGGAVSASGDNVTALTGLGTPSTSNVVGGLSTAKLATTTVTGVSGSTTPSVVQGRTSQTTADGTGTASTTNTDWLKGVSVSNETLVIGAATMDTQTTYSANAPATITVPTAAASATTVATGSTTTSGSGATVATGSSGTVSAVTGYANPTTDAVLGTASVFAVTNPTITLSTTGTSGPEVVTGVSAVTVTPTYKYMSGSASGTAVGANGTKSVVGADSTFTVTQPTITVTPSTTKLSATATNGNVAWNSKDQKTVLNNSTSITVTKGGE